jgi:aryl-alcohol dehydrogenase
VKVALTTTRCIAAKHLGETFPVNDLMEQPSLSTGTERIHSHFFGQSSFATWALCLEANAVKVPKDAPLELLGPLGCGIQTGAGAVINALRVQAGDRFAVFGTGPVGLSAVMAARLVGASMIIAIDLHESRLETARSVGATHTIMSANADPVAKIMELTGSAGVNFALDTTGIPSVIRQAVGHQGHHPNVPGVEHDAPEPEPD